MSNIKAFVLKTIDGLLSSPGNHVLVAFFKEMIEVKPIAISGLASGLLVSIDDDDNVTDVSRNKSDIVISWDRIDPQPSKLVGFVKQWVHYLGTRPDDLKECDVVGTFEAEVLFIEFDDQQNPVKCWRVTGFVPKENAILNNTTEVVGFKGNVTQDPEAYRLMGKILRERGL